jgi:hypothetical protein
MAAPIGNNNGAKAKKWEEAVRRALARAGGTVDKGLDALADQIVEKASSGDLWAIDHIANRLDGKPKETVDITVEHHDRAPVDALRSRIRPANTDTRTVN